MKKLNAYSLIPLIALSLLLPETPIQASQEPQGKVALFFDDCWKNQYDEAFPVLKEFEFKATFAVITDHIGQDRGTFWARMNLDELKMLQENGMEIASHTKSHPNMLNLTHERLIDEIANSKKALAQLGFNVKTFVYPYGEWNQTIIQQVKEAGYTCARTITPETYAIENLDANVRYHIGSWAVTNQSLREFQEILKNTGKGRIIVLTYHFISNEAPKETATPTRNFYEQMKYLKENGYEIVLLSEIFDTNDEKHFWSFLQLLGITATTCILITFLIWKHKSAARFRAKLRQLLAFFAFYLGHPFLKGNSNGNV